MPSVGTPGMPDKRPVQPMADSACGCPHHADGRTDKQAVIGMPDGGWSQEMDRQRRAGRYPGNRQLLIFMNGRPPSPAPTDVGCRQHDRGDVIVAEQEQVGTHRGASGGERMLMVIGQICVSLYLSYMC